MAELEEPKAVLSTRAWPRLGSPLTGRALQRQIVLAMIKRRATVSSYAIGNRKPSPLPRPPGLVRLCGRTRCARCCRRRSAGDVGGGFDRGPVYPWRRVEGLPFYLGRRDRGHHSCRDHATDHPARAAGSAANQETQLTYDILRLESARAPANSLSAHLVNATDGVGAAITRVRVAAEQRNANAQTPTVTERGRRPAPRQEVDRSGQL